MIDKFPKETELLERILYKTGHGLSSFTDEELSEMLGFIIGYAAHVRVEGRQQLIAILDSVGKKYD